MSRAIIDYIYILIVWTLRTACFKSITEQHVLTVLPKSTVTRLLNRGLMTEKVCFKVIDRLMFLKGHWLKDVTKRSLTEKCCQKVIDPKFCEEVVSSIENCFAKKPVAGIFLVEKKTIIGVSINKNNSVEKIIDRLVVKRLVSEQKPFQKMFRDRKAFDTEKVNYQNFFKTKRVYDIVFRT